MDRAITTNDISWWGYSVWIWTCIECDLAIICASIPCLRPLSKKFFFFLKASTFSKSATNQTQSGEHQMKNFSRRSKTINEINDRKEPKLGNSVTIRASSEQSLVAASRPYTREEYSDGDLNSVVHGKEVLYQV
jgi:hypothetical protein